MVWKKGQSGNPKGREKLPPGLPELITGERNEIKKLIVRVLELTDSEFSTRASMNLRQRERILFSCISEMKVTGNTDAFRKILEMVVGKLPEERETFPVSDEEKSVLLELRRRIEEERKRLDLITSPESS